MLIISMLSVINTALLFLILIRTGRTFAAHGDVIGAVVTAHNLQNRAIRNLDAKVEGALDCLLTIDCRAASAPEANVER